MSRDPVFAFLLPVLDHAHRVGDVPLISSPEWAELPANDLRKSGAVARAAMCWHRDGLGHAIRDRMLDELADADLFTRWRVRMAGHDVRGDTDWARIYEVVVARAEYRERWGVPAVMGDEHGENTIDLGGDKGKKSISSVLVEIALELYDLGVSDTGETFAIPRTGPKITHLLRGGRSSLRKQLAREYFTRTRKAAPQQALTDALLVIDGFAAEVDEEELALRVAVSRAPYGSTSATTPAAPSE